ncbi:glycoside hydrolase [Metschnikowia bicuspidata]|uniref:Glycoside hydrolase n=1 Tax=Metschnikowia bicuspidata TaxID=27322 RepID=A0A4P9ZC12_9ASCO|nr:glycoside hydrolase [Metschnikowia bicuspidata]
MPPQGMAWSPFNIGFSPRNENEIISDMNFIKEQGIPRIRIYGTDGIIDPILFNTCKKLGIKIDQGLWIGQGGVNEVDWQVDKIIGWAKVNGWDIFTSIIVGSEPILRGDTTALALILKITEVKAKLAVNGYHGLISTSEVLNTYKNNPSLCRDSPIDFVGLHAHLFFTGRAPEEAGQFILAEKENTERICNKPVRILETGFPTAGRANGKSIPSEENQKLVLNLILSATNGDVTLMSLFDDVWKHPGPFEIEQHFGIFKPPH